jgi:hypothetical protein
MLPQPEKVLRTRLNRGVWEILVQWMGQTTADATWEKVPEFKDAYPSFQLKDELFSIWGGGSVVDAFIRRKYQRRPKPREAQPAQSALPTAPQAQPTSLQGLMAEEKQPTAA